MTTSADNGFFGNYQIWNLRPRRTQAVNLPSLSLPHNRLRLLSLLLISLVSSTGNTKRTFVASMLMNATRSSWKTTVPFFLHALVASSYKEVKRDNELGVNKRAFLFYPNPYCPKIKSWLMNSLLLWAWKEATVSLTSSSFFLSTH